ncbi:uncharacterized protein LOC144645485 [Oculina patagonica]
MNPKIISRKICALSRCSFSSAASQVKRRLREMPKMTVRIKTQKFQLKVNLRIEMLNILDTTSQEDILHRRKGLISITSSKIHATDRYFMRLLAPIYIPATCTPARPVHFPKPLRMEVSFSVNPRKLYLQKHFI